MLPSWSGTLNAGAALWACGVADDLAGGVAAAQRSLDDGAANDRLRCYVEWTQSA